jgi:hypothetical protein
MYCILTADIKLKSEKKSKFLKEREKKRRLKVCGRKMLAC